MTSKRAKRFSDDISLRDWISLDRIRRVVDWAFRNRETGALTFGQFPNPALGVFLVATAAAWLIPAGHGRDTASGAAFGALLVWAADELLRGVNPWRRALGAGVLIYLGLTRLG